MLINASFSFHFAFCYCRGLCSITVFCPKHRVKVMLLTEAIKFFMGLFCNYFSRFSFQKWTNYQLIQGKIHLLWWMRDWSNQSSRMVYQDCLSITPSSSCHCSMLFGNNFKLEIVPKYFWSLLWLWRLF